MQKRMGLIRLAVANAADVRQACAFTEYVGGPQFSVTVTLAAAALVPGEIAGLALLSKRYAWLGVERASEGFALTQFDEPSGSTSRIPLSTSHVWLRAECDLVDMAVRFRYSTDGSRYAPGGEPVAMRDGPLAFQGVRCSLFAYSTQEGGERGHADFDSWLVTWP